MGHFFSLRNLESGCLWEFCGCLWEFDSGCLWEFVRNLQKPWETLRVGAWEWVFFFRNLESGCLWEFDRHSEILCLKVLCVKVPLEPAQYSSFMSSGTCQFFKFHLLMVRCHGGQKKRSTRAHQARVPQKVVDG